MGGCETVPGCDSEGRDRGTDRYGLKIRCWVGAATGSFLCLTFTLLTYYICVRLRVCVTQWQLQVERREVGEKNEG